MSAARTWIAALAGAGLAVLTLAAAAQGQTLTLDLGGDGAGSTTSRIFQLVALITILSLAPGILVMVTSFTRIIVVLGLLRLALGTQQSPPNVVIISLAMFLTAFIMAPTMSDSFNNGILPLVEERITEEEALPLIAAPFHRFMMQHVRESDLQLFLDIAKAGPEQTGERTPYQALIPAFMISELRRAFEIGFLIYVPFLIIDMVIASVLMSMGMMMLPPIIISLPFKLIFFVLVDGWYLVVGSMVRSFTGVAPG